MSQLFTRDFAPEIASLAGDSPTRPPDWRWRLVKANRPIARSRTDAWILAAKKLAEGVCFLTASEARSPDTDWEIHKRYNRASGYTGDAYKAWLIYVGQNKGMRAELEARLLAAEPTTEIAYRLRSTAPVILAYANVFFHVHDRLDCTSWVIHHVFGESYHLGASEKEYPLWWKMFGYFGGPDHLDDIIRRTRINADMSLEAAAKADREMNVALKALIAARSLSVNSYTQLPILEYAHRVDQDQDQSGRQSPVAAGLQDVLKHVMFSIAPPGDSDTVVEPSNGTDRSAISGIENAFSRPLALKQ